MLRRKPLGADAEAAKPVLTRFIRLKGCPGTLDNPLHVAFDAGMQMLRQIGVQERFAGSIQRATEWALNYFRADVETSVIPVEDQAWVHFGQANADSWGVGHNIPRIVLNQADVGKKAFGLFRQ